MTKEKQESLHKEFPEICHETGLAVGDGWFTILWALCACIRNHIINKRRRSVYKDEGKEEAIKQHPYPEFGQVKEKFGELRVYMDKTNDYVDGLVDMAETMSSEICEQCGCPGKCTSEFGWVKTMCEVCKEDRRKNGPKWAREAEGRKVGEKRDS